MTTGAGRAVSGACGAFRLGDLHLALPMAAIREVLDVDRLVVLPCAAVGLVGGIEVRGVVVPVLDLRGVLDRPAPPLPHPCVMVMVHEGAMLALLAEGVSGIFDGAAIGPGEVRLAAGGRPLVDGFVRADDGSMVNLLSPSALAMLPGVPMVKDPEPHRQCAPDPDTAVPEGPAEAGPGDGVPTLLVRCGAVRLAIDAFAVETTLSSPRIDPSPLARGHCLGVLHHGGVDVPVLDLLALCGLGRLAVHTGRQAFLVRRGEACVALLVDEVLDIVPVPPAAVARLPAFALPRPALFLGALPPNIHAAAGSDAEWACLLLDPAGLRDCEEVVALASLGGHGVEGRHCAADEVGSTGGSCRMLVYELDADTASPLDQVCEILPCTPVMAALQTGGAVRGLVVHRGRSVVVMCLAELVGRPRTGSGDGASVLLVECGGDLVGFIVPRLRSIEPARREPHLRGRAVAEGTTGAAGGLVLVGEGDAARLLPVLDLLQLARRVGAAEHRPAVADA